VRAHGCSGADTDSFLRIAAIARRFRHLRPRSDPRQASILWGHMLDKALHWYEPDPAADEDAVAAGATYKYPLGMSFLMSSALVRELTAPGVHLVHHIGYPYDDVVHGVWVADHAPDADILDDQAGFHDVSVIAGEAWARISPAHRDPNPGLGRPRA
jgi:hypothetical protein